MNSNGPLQVGGLYFGHDRISALAKGKSSNSVLSQILTM